MIEDGYRPGDFWRYCDVCGFKTRASQTRKRWDGAIVCLEDFEIRHPQDFVAGRKDRQSVPDPRPDPVAVVIGPLTTTVSQAGNAGDLTINIASSVRFGAGDHIGVLVDTGLHYAVVQSVLDATSLLLTAPLPAPLAADTTVINYSAVSQPDIG